MTQKLDNDARYDFEKESDKEFLREAGKLLQEKVIKLQLDVNQLQLEKSQDEDIKSKLTGELLILRRRVFDSRQEKKLKAKELTKKKRKAKTNLVHNQNPNRRDIEASDHQITLTDKEIEYRTDTCPNCGKEELSDFCKSWEESSEFDVNASYYILKRHKRKKYKCGGCEKIVAAPGPSKLTPGGQFSIQLATQIACDKYEHHIPLERQRVKMRNFGLLVSVKTLFSVKEHLYHLIYELNELNRADILQGKYVCLDESPMPFFNPNKSNGFVWSLSNNIGAYYQFEPNRTKAIARELVKNYQGIVMTDGYSSYGCLGQMDGVIHAYCWAHLRRYFFDALAENEHAGEVIDYIDKFYEIEHMAQNYEELKVLRETRSAQVYKDLKAWMDENEGSYLPTSTLTGKAIGYFYNQREGLEHFLKNENVPLDNNAAERRQRCPVMGRKNFQAFRSINGADVGMFFYSIIESCKTNGLNASGYTQEMALRKTRGEELESPHRYASKIKEEIGKSLIQSLTSTHPM